MKQFSLGCALAFAMAAPVLAGNAEAPGEVSTGDIGFEEWRAMSAGKTLTYRIDGAFWALERYAPTGNRVMLQLNTGECLEGTWAYEDGTFCYAWDSGEQSCFRHTRMAGEIYVIHMENGEPTGGIQTMSHVSDLPLSCEPAAIS